MKQVFLLIFILLLSTIPYLHANLLQQAYLSSNPGLGYDRLIILDQDSIYTGGLIISDEKIGIKGHGAIIDLLGSSINVTGNSQIDLDGCVIINGSDAFHATGDVNSLITQCTFYGNQTGILFQSTGVIEVVNTIISNSIEYGFACEKYSGRILHYIDMYQNAQGDYMEWCPG
jgi:hypothetical protein